MSKPKTLLLITFFCLIFFQTDFYGSKAKKLNVVGIFTDLKPLGSSSYEAHIKIFSFIMGKSPANSRTLSFRVKGPKKSAFIKTLYKNTFQKYVIFFELTVKGGLVFFNKSHIAWLLLDKKCDQCSKKLQGIQLGDGKGGSHTLELHYCPIHGEKDEIHEYYD
ncbi:MAG: hypothetical protein OEZ36_12365 [Spirochaetota bacterium]|nr:hypothetical protein [Spirochaetota bacterium]